MEWVHLVVSVNGALYTVNALVPVRNNRLLFAPSFFASWITIELAWFHLVWQAVATGFFVARGTHRTRPGKLALVLTLASWVGLLVTIRHSLGARRTVRDGFRELDHPVPELRRHAVRRTRNVTYARVAGKDLRLDVFAPEETAPSGTRRPALLQIHGGGWVVGDKREQAIPLQMHLASQGWVCFNANYRLSPGATFPDHLVDLKRALAFIRAHADTYGIDPDFVAVTGGSAGGHLAALVALTANDPQYQPGFEEADTSIQAAVPFYGVYDLTNRHDYMPAETVPRFVEPILMKAFLAEEPERFAAASPIDQVHAGAPPFLVIHGDRDTLAPVEAARDFVEGLRGVSKAPVLYLELHGAQHAFELFPSIRARHVIRAVGHFLDAVHAQHREGQGASPLTSEELVAAVEVDPEIEPVTA